LIDHLVCIVLQCRCEDYYLIELGHQLDEIHTTRSYKEVAVRSVLYKKGELVKKQANLYLDIVDEGLVKIKHQGVGGLLFVSF
jgi:hypothetical protein